MLQFFLCFWYISFCFVFSFACFELSVTMQVTQPLLGSIVVMVVVEGSSDGSRKKYLGAWPLIIWEAPTAK